MICYRNVYDYGTRLHKASIPRVSLHAARKSGKALLGLDTLFGVRGARWLGVEMIDMTKKGITVIIFYPNKDKP